MLIAWKRPCIYFRGTWKITKWSRLDHTVLAYSTASLKPWRNLEKTWHWREKCRNFLFGDPCEREKAAGKTQSSASVEKKNDGSRHCTDSSAAAGRHYPSVVRYRSLVFNFFFFCSRILTWLVNQGKHAFLTQIPHNFKMAIPFYRNRPRYPKARHTMPLIFKEWNNIVEKVAVCNF